MALNDVATKAMKPKDRVFAIPPRKTEWLKALATQVSLRRQGKEDADGTVSNFVCGRAVKHYAAMALMKRSPNRTANWAFAMVHSGGGMIHSFSDRFKIR